MTELLPGLEAAPNIHPMLVHFPFALWLAALLIWAAFVATRKDGLWSTGRLLLTLGTLGGMAAVASGYWATDQMGHTAPGHDLVHVHRNWMVATTVLAALTTAGAWLYRGSSFGPRLGLVGLLLVTGGLLTAGADRGAELVYRYGVGVLNEAPPSEGHDHGTGDHHAEPHDHGGHDH